MPTTQNVTAGVVLQLVRSGGVRTRRELMDLTGVSRSTLALRIGQLTAAGFLRESGRIAAGAGRPTEVLAFAQEEQLVVGVDLGASHLRVAVMRGDGQILVDSAGPVRPAGPEEVLPALARRVSDLLARSGRDVVELAGVGIGIPGPVRFDLQRPNTPPLMPGWHDVPVADRLAELLSVRVLLDNDANLMALGESREHHQGSGSLLFVKVGTGIGAGIVLDGQPERGMSGGAGDIGHIRIAQAGDRPCTCGAVGCLATVASGGAIVRTLREQGVSITEIAELGELIQDGHPDALAATEHAGHLLGEVLATSVALLNPAALVIGGRVPHLVPRFVDAVRSRVFDRTVPLATRELVIAPSRLGPDAALQGARHLVMDRAFSAEAVDARLAPAASGGV